MGAAMFAVPWPSSNPHERPYAQQQQTQQVLQPENVVHAGQPYMFAQPMSQFPHDWRNGSSDARYGAPTPRPDEPIAEAMKHPSPARPAGRIKVSNRWQTEYRFQYSSAVPRPPYPGFDPVSGGVPMDAKAIAAACRQPAQQQSSNPGAAAAQVGPSNRLQ